MKIYGFSNVATFILILFELSPNFYIIFYGVPLFTCRDLLFTCCDLLFCAKQLKLAVYSEKLGSFPSEICIHVTVICIK